jgi:hypothetical protein
MVLQRLTPEIEHRILAHIRNGGFAHMAAEAAGIPRGTFAGWLERGRQKRSRGRYVRFWLNVIQARAQARLAAELETRKKDVKFWLRYGPGKEARHGWGVSAKGRTRKPVQGQAAEDLHGICVRVVQALAAHPEARLSVLEVLEPAGITTPVPINASATNAAVDASLAPDRNDA